MKRAAYFFISLCVLFFGCVRPILALEVWNGFNSVKILKEYALVQGVNANTIAMLLLLPVIATLVSFVHYYVGLTGYGIFMPTMIAVIFLSTGVLGGIALFALILGVSLISNAILKKLKLHFWPARAINLVFIGIGVVLVWSLASQYFKTDLSNIYAIMIMILLVEEFVRTQLIKSKNEAWRLTFGTLLLAILGAGMMNISIIQSWVLSNPDITVLSIIIANIVIGSYRGIRLTEIGRFSKAIRK
ncbi:MAG: hypothetical protein EOM23_01185 [Candidatus Moranbacteria bacterium]|nr:hypothetical protein [Candidatus Moranbacteria bacterium]